MLEWNVVCFGCMINNYAFMHVLVQSISNFIIVCSWGLVSRVYSKVYSMSVVSSSSVRGSGTLQCGIRAHVTAWYLMGHEEAVIEERFPSDQ